jgi:D-xylose transport system substrate-binding protein
MAGERGRATGGIAVRSPLLVAVLFLILSAAIGCGGESRGGTIAFLLAQQGVPVLRQDYREFEKKVEALCPNCTVVYRDAEGGAGNQLEQAEAVLAGGADVLVVDPVEPEAASEIVQKAKPQKVPVVSFNRLIMNARVDYYVGVDEEEAGRLQGQALVERLGEEGKPQAQIVSVADRGGRLSIGARDAIDSGGLKVVKEYDIEEASTFDAEIEMRKAIEELGPNSFAGVYSSDDEIAWGVIEAMEFTRVDPAQKPVTGGGATLSALQRMLEGKQYMTVYEATQEQAHAAAEVAVELAKGNEVPNSWITDEPANGLRDVPSVLLRPTAVTKDTIDKTVVANGFVDSAQLCAGKYSKYCREDGIPTQH